MVLAGISETADPDRNTSPSMDALMEHHGMSRRTIRRKLKEADG
jgi:transcriptional antiterminator